MVATIAKNTKYGSVSRNTLNLGIGIVLIGGTIGGTVYMVNKAVKDIRENSATDDIFKRKGNSFPAEEIALKLKVAFENCGNTQYWTGFCFGTDEEAVFQAIEEIPTKKDFNEVVKAYKKMTRGRELNRDLEEELKDTQGHVMKVINMINAKPEK